jgi:hypothetical protein
MHSNKNRRQKPVEHIGKITLAVVFGKIKNQPDYQYDNKEIE